MVTGGLTCRAIRRPRARRCIEARKRPRHRPFDEGLALIERSLALNPNSANAWMGSGFARAFLGDSETALAHLERSARLSPLDPLAYLTWQGTAVAHFIAGHYEEASALCDRALHEAPDYPPAIRVKVAISGLMGGSNDRHKWVERLLAVTPDATVSSLWAYYHVMFKKPSYLDAFLEGLRKAGLPE